MNASRVNASRVNASRVNASRTTNAGKMPSRHILQLLHRSWSHQGSARQRAGLLKERRLGVGN